ncbi:MAG: tRNA (adenosine(37)-N6)-dimethylallyltransferase MiaA [Omnitrophica bacterium]|nr:tRNA (adenosine(37)-N6)-dimethylallyltransferase MiaA [Candidatus Omnitrophota bacterium]
MVDTVIVIVGATAAGKSEFAIRLAQKIEGEIISADSMQAYKCMEILSQAPTGPEKARSRHHLINFLKPTEVYSAAIFSALAGKKIKNIIKRGKVPIVAGGSGLYIKALIDGLFPSKGKNIKLRKKLQALAGKKGRAFLYERLREKDPAACGKIHPNDLKRVIRAIEICEVEGKTKTGLARETRGIKDEYDVKVFGLTMDRKKLYERIEKRVDLMFRKGVVKEVERLLCMKPGITAAQAIGVKQLQGYFNKQYSLEKAKEILKRDTRRFAKRQLTWFKGDKQIVWLDIDKRGKKQAVNYILKSITA